MELEEKLSLLVNKIKEDESYFHQFYDLTKKKIFYNIFAIIKDYQLSEDILQETYITFLEKINTINTNKSVLGFLYKISRNKALDYYRKHKKHIDYDLLSNNERFSYENSKDHSNELLNLIINIVDDIEYQVIILHIVNGLTNKEIAMILKKPTNTIIWIYNKAIKKIKERLGEDYA